MNNGDMDNGYDIERADAFISYKDYLQLPQFKDYVEKNGVVLPSKITIAKREKTAADENVVAENKRKVNVGAIITCVFALLFIAWAAIGCFAPDNEKATVFFVLYGGQSAEGIVRTLLDGGYAGDAVSMAAAVACLLAIVVEVVFGVIGSLTRLRKKGMGIAVTVGTLLAFALTLAAAVVGMIQGNGEPMGAAIFVSALAFFASIIAGVGDRKVKENG